MTPVAVAEVEKAAERVSACFRALALHLVECHTCGGGLVLPGAVLWARTVRCAVAETRIEEWRAAGSAFWDLRYRATNTAPPAPAGVSHAR